MSSRRISNSVISSASAWRSESCLKLRFVVFKALPCFCVGFRGLAFAWKGWGGGMNHFRLISFVVGFGGLLLPGKVGEVG